MPSFKPMFPGGKATWEHIQELQRVLKYPIGRAATLVVAASDASAKVKAQADYVCDGTADDVEIQAAIDALPASGGKVMLSEGTFNVANTISLKSNMSLEGNSWATILKQVFDSAVPVLKGLDLSNVLIRNLAIDGNKTTNLQGLCIQLDGVQMAILDSLYLHDAQQQGIDLAGTNRRTQDIYITHCLFKDIDKQGVLGHTSAADRIWVVDNVFIAVDTDGETAVIHPYNDNNYWHILNNRIVGGAGLYAIEIGHGTSDANYNRVQGNIISDLAASNLGGIVAWKGQRTIIKDNVLINIPAGARGAIGLLTSFSCIIANNLILYSKRHGIHVENSYYNIISGNHIHYSSQELANTYSDILLTDNGVTLAQLNTITSNLCVSLTATKSKYGIREDVATCAYNLILGNIVRNHGTAEISTQAATTVVRGNIGYVTENSGTATVTAGTTSVNVTHGLATTPTRVILTPTTDTGGKRYWVSAKGATTFTITIDSTHTSDISFDWRAQVGEG